MSHQVANYHTWLVHLAGARQERRLESTAASFTAAISACDAGTDPIHALRGPGRTGAGLHMLQENHAPRVKLGTDSSTDFLL